MKKYLILYALLTTSVIYFGAKLALAERTRLKSNQTALMQQAEHYRTRLGEAAASVQALQLRCAEYERTRTADAEKIRSLGIWLRRVEATAKSVSTTEITAKAPLQTSVIERPDTVPALLRDTLHTFRWRDAWVEICGTIRNDSVECLVRSTDTLRQVVHRVPRRFLGIPFGTKAIRQEIFSSNPHTRIVYTEYITLGRRSRHRQ